MGRWRHLFPLFLAAFPGMLFGNLTWAAWCSGDYARALERSFFQAVAILICGLIQALEKRP